jgi:2-oxoglutarate dehydrogenase E1 component
MVSFDVNMSNAAYIEDLYERYKKNPGLVDEQWRAFFVGFDLGSNGNLSGAFTQDVGHLTSGDRGAMALVNAYRTWGHMVANVAPMSYTRPPYPVLDISEYGFSEADLDLQVGNGGFMGSTDGTLRDLLAKLKLTYCDSLGIEFAEIPYKSQREWLERQMEPTHNHPKFTRDQCRDILIHLVASESF